MKALGAAAFAAVVLFAALATTPAAAQSAVQNFRCVNQGSDVRCTWDSVPGARFYILVDSNDGGASVANRYVLSAGTTSHVISNRNTATWSFRVQNDNNAPTAWTQSEPTATPTPTSTPTATATATHTPTRTPIPTIKYLGEFEARVRDGRTLFSWPEVDEGSMATEWVLEWRYSYETTRHELTPPDVSTPILSGDDWMADSNREFAWETVYWTVRLGEGERSEEVRALYVPPTPEPTVDPDATATPVPTATPYPGAVGQDGDTAVAVTMVPRIQDSRNFWMFIAVVATAVSGLALNKIKFPYPGEAALFVGICCIVVGVVKTGMSPLILLLGIGFGCALVILLLRIQR